MNKDMILMFVVEFLFLAIGLSALFFPKKIQQLAMADRSKYKYLKYPVPCRIRSASYIPMLRLIGAMSTAAAVLGLVVIVLNLYHPLNSR